MRKPVDDYWNIGGDTSLSEPWIGVTRVALFNINPPEEKCGFRQTNEEPGHNKTRNHMAGRMVKHVDKARSVKTTKWTKEQPKVAVAK